MDTETSNFNALKAVNYISLKLCYVCDVDSCLHCRRWWSWRKYCEISAVQSWDHLFYQPLARCSVWLQVRCVQCELCVYLYNCSRA